MPSRRAPVWPWLFVVVALVLIVKAPDTAAVLAHRAVDGISAAVDGIARFAEKYQGASHR